jgi:hypothetical protein
VKTSGRKPLCYSGITAVFVDLGQSIARRRRSEEGIRMRTSLFMEVEDAVKAANSDERNVC